MNKKLFLVFISVLVLTPTVLALTPTEVLGKVIDFIANDIAPGSQESFAYVRIIFGAIIAFIVYELLSRLNVLSGGKSVLVGLFFAFIGVMFAPKALLLTAVSTYNIVIWAILLGIPVIITAAVAFFIPSVSVFARIVKIALTLALFFVIGLTTNGVRSAFSNLFGPTDNVALLASWAYFIVLIFLIWQLGGLIKDIWTNLDKSRRDTKKAARDAVEEIKATTQTTANLENAKGLLDHLRTTKDSGAINRNARSIMQTIRYAGHEEEKHLGALVRELESPMKNLNGFIAQVEGSGKTIEDLQNIKNSPDFKDYPRGIKSAVNSLLDDIPKAVSEIKEVNAFIYDRIGIHSGRCRGLLKSIVQLRARIEEDFGHLHYDKIETSMDIIIGLQNDLRDIFIDVADKINDVNSLLDKVKDFDAEVNKLAVKIEKFRKEKSIITQESDEQTSSPEVNEEQEENYVQLLRSIEESVNLDEVRNVVYMAHLMLTNNMEDGRTITQEQFRGVENAASEKQRKGFGSNVQPTEEPDQTTAKSNTPQNRYKTYLKIFQTSNSENEKRQAYKQIQRLHANGQITNDQFMAAGTHRLIN